MSGLDEAQAACLVRADPTEDETNGFFVAVFQREVGGNASGDGFNTTGSKRRNRHKNRDKKAKKRQKREEEAKGEGVDAKGSILRGVDPDLRIELEDP